jgi:serine/threonine-protein kinase HipA
MTSEKAYREAFVWLWLPGEVEPVVAGKLEVDNDFMVFNYGKSYLARDNAISIYDGELPLQQGALSLSPCVRIDVASL